MTCFCFPKVAAEVAAPLSQAKKITMVSKGNMLEVESLKSLPLIFDFWLWRLFCQVSDGSGEVGAARITSEVLEVMVKVGKIFQYFNIWWWCSRWAKYFYIWWLRWSSRWTKYIFPFKVPDMVNRMTGVDVTNVRTIPEKYLWISLKFKSFSTLNYCPCSSTVSMQCDAKKHITFYF